ncbi:MAG: ribonuclease HII [Sphaerobacter sp.]|nr:ribonuclease HII [Sphaerobacter sp.]
MRSEQASERCASTAPVLSVPDAGRPTAAIEATLWARGLRRVAGVDEVGRGCVAGPVVAAACILPPGLEDIPGVRDSKTLSGRQRERLAAEIRRVAIAVGIGAASHREVDRLNVRVASALAMQRALARLGAWDHVLYDGHPLPELDPERATAVVKGDATCLSIACASILAKVVRDHLMARLARRHPEYGWDRNAGYGTEEHLAALRRAGPTPHHRRTFAPVRELLAGQLLEPR